MAECQLHWVGTTGLRAPVHQFQLQRTPRRTASSRGFATLTRQMGELNMRTTNIDKSLGQHIESTQKLAVIHRREDPQSGAAIAAIPGGVESLLPFGLGLIPTSSSEPEASLGEDPHERYLVSNSIFTAFQNLASNQTKNCKILKIYKNLHN